MFKKAGIRKIQSWEEWKELWASTDLSEFLQGLLHIGWNIWIPRHEKQFGERVCFYLDVADGHNDNRHPHQPIARKSFETLSVRFFKGNNELRDPWRLAFFDTGVCEKLLWFFRINPDRDRGHDMHTLGHIPNLGQDDSHHRRLAEEFLCNFAKYLYHYAREMQHPDTATQRQQAIEILWGLNKLPLLLGFTDVHNDDVCVNAVLEIAVRNTCMLRVGKKIEIRKPISLDEALLATDYDVQRVAEVLAVLLARRKAQSRLVELAALEK